jgi:uncharacterized RDD family membrane protein YckC
MSGPEPGAPQQATNVPPMPGSTNPPPATDIPPAPPMPVPPVYQAAVGGAGRSGADPRWAGRLATPWRRLGGWAIDALVFTPVAVAIVFAYLLPRLRDDPVFRRIASGGQVTPAESDALMRHVQATLIGPFLALSIGLSLLYGLYTVLLTRTRGQTVGKMAVGTRVVQRTDGSLPTWGNAILRWALPACASIVPSVGGIAWLLIYLWMLWDPNVQGLQDKLAGTVVVRV